MKKTFLLLTTLLIGLFVTAQVKTQGLTASSTHLDSVYTMWNANKGLTVDHKPTLLTFDFSDTTTLSFKDFWTESATNNPN